jgi:hypothetical protein
MSENKNIDENLDDENNNNEEVLPVETGVVYV